ncbi:septation protein SepH [Microbacterium sp. zg.Y1090]|uniref:septation protein SepH n=1 Tax=Microbacterium TaxID=33882 RepID=UPI00214CBED3|nr:MULTISPECIES: septation protein SepH [unclassified Microbacterium]MCR2811843.1 septation protein SepH [Microbacterium sp. zg.Y1084]MCR2818718.1 septation protein SepH [Microbacterium sp. zg.Y1090]MDL5486531.1 septation protein SepH [Microbacterium sp. zg-Y1211]WIM27039.1 septation protein SepH [Microbacterium sp. zg-Y1090]
MEQLKVIGTEDGTLVLATETGERFALPVDDVLRAELRKARRDRDGERRAPKASPREIQSHIRSGMSAAEVAELLGARLEDVQRYEGPVLAEREHIVGQALAVPVLVGSELEPDAQPTFGAAVRAKLAEAGAAGERWTSWREQTGWIVKLEFTANDVDHDARWTFDPRRSTLAPQNSDATQLSRQGALPEGLIPRLRALDHPMGKDDSRFDSGAFGPRRPAEPEAEFEVPDVRTPTAPAVQSAAIKRAPDAPVTTSSETADLLEALRRRRGQREPLPGATQPEPSSTSPSPIALFDNAEPSRQAPAQETVDEHPASGPASEGTRRRGGRPSMPSWDEIVFGARTEES